MSKLSMKDIQKHTERNRRFYAECERQAKAKIASMCMDKFTVIRNEMTGGGYYGISDSRDYKNHPVKRRRCDPRFLSTILVLIACRKGR